MTFDLVGGDSNMDWIIYYVSNSYVYIFFQRGSKQPTNQMAFDSHGFLMHGSARICVSTFPHS